MSSSSSLSSSDDENIRELPRNMIPRMIRDRNDPFEMYGNVEFKQRFRFNKGSVMELLHKIGSAIEPRTERNKSINAKLQLLVALRFYATGGFQMTIGDHVNIKKSSVCRIIRRVSIQIAKLKPQFIFMPTNLEERSIIAAKFHEISGLPRVLGAIDCTHIRISSPGGQNSEWYRNRKGFFSINVQVICDAELKIRHIIARWPGSVHDSTIFNDSPLLVELEQGIYGNSYLVGDSGYPCRRFLLTPIHNPRNQSESRYNAAHIKTRNPIERLFGVWKRRFPCLHYTLRNKLDTTSIIIVACSVLHNFSLIQNDEYQHLDDFESHEEVSEPLSSGNQNTVVRSAIVEAIFGS